MLRLVACLWTSHACGVAGTLLHMQASRMRLLANEPSSTNAVVVAAVSGSRGVPESIEPATTPDTIHYHVPRYSLVRLLNREQALHTHNTCVAVG